MRRIPHDYARPATRAPRPDDTHRKRRRRRVVTITPRELPMNRSPERLRTQVRAALGAADISQAEAARQLGLSAKHMSHMLTGRATLTLDWADRVLAICGARLELAVTEESGATSVRPRIPLDDLTSDQLDQLYDRAEGAEAARDRLFRSRDRQAARANRYRLAWKSARARAKRAQRAQDGELRHAKAMWSHALRDLHRYRTAWKSARHRAALYLQSNQNLAASLDNGHASQLHAHKVAQSAARDAATALSRQLDAEAALDRVRALADRWALPGHISMPTAANDIREALGEWCPMCGTSGACNGGPCPLTAPASAPAAPADRATDLAAGIRAAADEIAGIDFHPKARARSLDIATGLVHRLRRLADEAQPTEPATAATEEPQP